ncbi:MAG: tripartite tricarboxylate transporter substrate-binding protein [Burkholderiales bacterium]
MPDNRPGATSNIGLELAAKSPPDGYTIVLSAPTIAISPSLFTKLNYDALRDLAPVTLVAAMEAGVDDFVVPIWYGILAPAGTPRGIVDRLNSELHKALASADLKERLANAGVEPLTNTPEEFGASSIRKWAATRK